MGAEHAALAGFIGTDKAADEIWKLCCQEEIVTSFLIQIDGETASNRIYLSPEGERYSKSREWRNGVKDNSDFTEVTWKFILSHDLISIPYNDRYLDELIHRRRKYNFISVDFMHFDSPKVISKYLPFIDIAFVSPEKKSLRWLEKMAFSFDKPIVALMGAEGSYAFYNGIKINKQAIKVDKVIDTTGCGDAYQAAFCYALNQGTTPEEAMNLAIQIATTVLKGYGGIYKGN